MRQFPQSTLCLCVPSSLSPLYFFFFNDTATTEIYTLSLHDALPIYLHALGDLLLEPLLAVLRRDARAERLSLVPALGEDARQATGDIVALRVGHEDEHAPVHRGLLFDDLEQHPILGVEVIER